MFVDGLNRRLTALVVAGSLMTTGCLGGSSESAGADPSAGLPVIELEASDAMLASAVERTNALSSYRFAMLVAFDGSALGLDEVRFEVDGVMDPATGEGEFTMDMSSLLDMAPAGQRDQMEDMLGGASFDVVQSGGTAYMRMPMLAGQIPGGADWIAMPTGGTSQALGSMGLAFQDPSTMLDELRSSAEVVEVGPARIGGVDTTMFQVTLDATEVDPTGMLTGDLPLMVWIDQRGVLRRVELQFDMFGMTGGIVMELSDFGVEVDVDVPSDFVTIDPSTFG